jgi:hypothetical protein
MSTQADALALLDVAAGENPAIPWKLNWQDALRRLRTLVMHPDRLHQRALNACGPAAFFRIWFSRDPLGAATFGYRLLKSGSASIGPVTVRPGAALLAQDYATLRASANAVAPSSMPEDADWMLMSALRDSENHLIDYLGQPNTVQDRFAGMTLPSTLATWLQGTNVYSTVVNNTTVLSNTWESLQALNPTPIADVALLMNAGFMDLHPAPSGTPSSADWLRIPDHYVQLLKPVAVGASAGWIKLSLWTWGRDEIDKWTSEAKFLSNYFGPVIAFA